jgi:hypothetical protein
MTGEKVNAQYFEHNNMTPFFGAKTRTGIAEPNVTEGVLDSYSGAGTHFIKKTEASPLFSPGENYHFPHGAPNKNDFYQSRVNPSLRMANVKPFQSETVAPGLGLGYTTEGQGGYNSGMAMRDRWVDKTVDELRVNTKQKASGIGLLGHEGPAMSSNPTINNASAIGHFEKQRVERAFSMGPERYFTTTGVEKKPALKPVPIDRFTNRPETSMSYTGVAGAMDQTYHTGEYMESKHIDLGQFPLGAAKITREATSGDYGWHTNKAYMNNRSVNEPETYYGAFSGAIGSVIAPLLDELRPSKKQNVIGTLRPYQNPSSSVTNSKSYFFNPGDRPSTTIRETTETNTFTNGVNRNQNGGAYQVTEYQPVVNERDSTSFYYSGNAGAATKATRTYDAEYAQRNNDIKSSTIQGHMVPGNMNLLNSDIHMRNRQGEQKNTRSLGKTSGPTELYQPEMMGVSHSKQDLYSTLQLDRNTPDILNAFRSNPYTHNLTNVP